MARYSQLCSCAAVQLCCVVLVVFGCLSLEKIYMKTT